MEPAACLRVSAPDATHLPHGHLFNVCSLEFTERWLLVNQGPQPVRVFTAVQYRARQVYEMRHTAAQSYSMKWSVV